EYRVKGSPVAANDAWDNTVSASSTATIITDNDASTSNLPVTDDSAAGQSALGTGILQFVSNPLPDNEQLDCFVDGGFTWADDEANGAYRPGDTVCWRVTVPFPDSVDTIAPVIRDFLPNGFAFEDWEYGPAHNISVDIDFEANVPS